MIAFAHEHLVGVPPERLTLAAIAPTDDGSPAARRADGQVLEGQNFLDDRIGPFAHGRNHRAPDGGGTFRSLQILRASRKSISRWRGITERA
jgi:hypothetical protein